jgi:hypothetical protein
MLKAAESLREAGYDVRVVSANFESWATDADRYLHSTRSLDWTIVDYSRASANMMRVRAGARMRSARSLARIAGAARLPLPLLGRATTRVFPELVRATVQRPVDLVFGGGGALAATAAAARRLHVPYAVDLEDLHSGEHSDTAEGRLSQALAEAAEKLVFQQAVFLTTASESMADAYRDKYGRRPLVINNTFPLPLRGPDFSPRNTPLRLYWFSQTIGPRRGLEDCVAAVGMADLRCELHLRGKPVAGYLAALREYGKRCARGLDIISHDPAPPDEIVESSREMDIGLAVEPGFGENNRRALSNKAFTYILAGLAVVFTDTPGQHDLAMDLGPGALLYVPGDVKSLASGLRAWAENPAQLLAARRAAWAAACRRWHWKHPDEEGVLLSAVRKVLG